VPWHVVGLGLAIGACGEREDPVGACEFGIQDGWVAEDCPSADLPADLVFACSTDAVSSYDEDTARQWGTTEGAAACRAEQGGGDGGGGGGGGGGGVDLQACYDTGWNDCARGWEPGAMTDVECDAAYVQGFCDCEYYYDMVYYCE
jgi:hypothetical protein